MRTSIKRLPLLLLALIFVFVQLTCAPISGDVTPGIEETVKTIASDQFTGRVAGGTGNAKCAKYISDRYKAIGLETFESNSYYQKFKQTMYPVDKQVHELTVLFEDGSTKTYVYGQDYTESIKVKNADVSLPVTYDIQDENIGEKIVLLEDKKDFPKVYNKAAAAIAKSDYLFQALAVRERGGIPYVSVMPEVFNEIKTKKAARVTLKIKYEPLSVQVSNVIGKIKGSSSENALVLSAHFDHVGMVGKTIFKGAVDNASGTAVLLDLAEKLKAQSEKTPFKMDIIIAAFNGEEYGLIGSRYFAERVKSQYKNIYDINLDCIGMKNGGDLAIEGDESLNKDLMTELSKYIEKQGVPFITGEVGLTSDHESFIQNGLCGVNLGQKDILRAKGVHTPEDTVDIVDFDYLKKIRDAVYEFVLKNDGKIFAGSLEQAIAEEADPIMIAYEKLDKMARETDLAYDEMKTVEVDGYKCILSGGTKPLAAEEIKKYYPTMGIPEGFMNFNLKQAFIYDGNDMFVNPDKFYSKEDIGKIQKRTLSLETIRHMRLYYENDGEELIINIAIRYPDQPNPYLTVFKSEQVTVNGKTYYLIKDSQTEQYRNLCSETTVNGKKYIIMYDKFSQTEPTACPSKEDLMKIAENAKGEDLIKGLGI